MMVDFYVVDTLSPYNIILGRNLLTPNKAICTSYNLMIKFQTEHGIAEVRENQQVENDCTLVAIKGKFHPGKMDEDIK